MTSSPLRDAISSVYLANEDAVVDQRIAQATLSPAEAAATQKMATELVARIRKDTSGNGALDPHRDQFTPDGLLY